MDIKRCRVVVFWIHFFSLLICKTHASWHLRYQGTCGTTLNGRTCQRWDTYDPHLHGQQDARLYPDATLEEAGNYCRDPDGTGYLWCYTTDVKQRWEACDVIDCPINEEPFCYGKEPAIDICKSGSIAGSTVYIDTGRVPANKPTDCACHVTIGSIPRTVTDDAIDPNVDPLMANVTVSYKTDYDPAYSNLKFCGQNFNTTSEDSECYLLKHYAHVMKLESPWTRTRACMKMTNPGGITVTCFPDNVKPVTTTTTTTPSTTTSTTTTPIPVTTEGPLECRGQEVVHMCTNTTATAPSVTLDTTILAQNNVTSCVCHVDFTDNVTLRYTPDNQVGVSTLTFCDYNFTDTTQEETCKENGDSLFEVRFDSHGHSTGACLEFISTSNVTVMCYIEGGYPKPTTPTTTPGKPKPTESTERIKVEKAVVIEDVGLATVVGAAFAGIMFATLIVAVVVAYRRQLALKERKFVVKNSLYSSKEKERIKLEQIENDPFKEDDMGHHGQLTAIRVGYKWIKNRLYGQSGDFSNHRLTRGNLADRTSKAILHEKSAYKKDNKTIDVDGIVKVRDDCVFEETFNDKSGKARKRSKERVIEVTDDFVYERNNDNVENNNRKSIFGRMFRNDRY